MYYIYLVLLLHIIEHLTYKSIVDIVRSINLCDKLLLKVW